MFINNLLYLINRSGKSRSEIANDLGYSTHSRISNYLNGHSYPRSGDLIEMAKYFNVSVEDLTGKDLTNSIAYVKEPVVKYKVPEQGIPLIPVDAMAGYSKGDSDLLSLDYEFYSIPEFRNKADFLIRISGTSMSPKYFNGDIVACKKIPTKTFLQWGKVYVMDTEQGPICKRVMASKKENHIICRSENSELYPEFELPWSKVRALAIVVGVIRLE
jgi:phage repressor protein C with HTH and peptisase S24 domain